MRQKTTNLVGSSLIVTATVNDWFYMEAKTAKANSIVIESGIKIRFIGGKVRVFKPGNPLHVQVSGASLKEGGCFYHHQHLWHGNNRHIGKHIDK